MRKTKSKSKVDGLQPRFYLLLFYLVARRIKKWRKAKEKKKFMAKHGVDLCCPGCLTWTSEKPWIGVMTESKMHWHATCQLCNHTSHWSLYAPIPILDPDYKGPVAECDAADCNSEGEG